MNSQLPQTPPKKSCSAFQNYPYHHSLNPLNEWFPPSAQQHHLSLPSTTNITLTEKKIHKCFQIHHKHGYGSNIHPGEYQVSFLSGCLRFMSLFAWQKRRSIKKDLIWSPSAGEEDPFRQTGTEGSKGKETNPYFEQSITHNCYIKHLWRELSPFFFVCVCVIQKKSVQHPCQPLHIWSDSTSLYSKCARHLSARVRWGRPRWWTGAPGGPGSSLCSQLCRMRKLVRGVWVLSTSMEIGLRFAFCSKVCSGPNMNNKLRGPVLALRHALCGEVGKEGRMTIK